MIPIRSLFFNICFFIWAMLSAILYAPAFIISSRASVAAGAPWAKVALWMVRICCGVRYEIRGRENLVDGPVIYASKHQSAWDTIIFLTLFKWPAYVLKRELLRIPLWGWYLWRMQMIAIDRSAGAGSMKQMIRDSKEALANQRPIVIFPEGTRKTPGNPPQYHPGIVALYSQLGVPVIPAALNSGCYWGKDAFHKYPGTIIIEFLPAIPAGLDKKVFAKQMQDTIETTSQRLLEEAKVTHPSPITARF